MLSILVIVVSLAVWLLALLPLAVPRVKARALPGARPHHLASAPDAHRHRFAA